jgi:hypothetical protein
MSPSEHRERRTERVSLTEREDIVGVCIVRIFAESLRYAGINSKRKGCRTNSQNALYDSNILPPCIAITFEAISSARWAVGSCCIISARNWWIRIAYIPTFFHSPGLPEASFQVTGQEPNLHIQTTASAQPRTFPMTCARRVQRLCPRLVESGG